MNALVIVVPFHDDVTRDVGATFDKCHVVLERQDLHPVLDCSKV
jgi:hypothetical protein